MGGGLAASVGLTEAVEGMEIFVRKFDGFQEFRAKRGNYISACRVFVPESPNGKA
jgi:hypothetical protein